MDYTYQLLKAFAKHHVQVSLDYNHDYGIDHRSGWSIVVNGSVVAQLVETPWDASVAALRYLDASETLADKAADIINDFLESVPGFDSMCIQQQVFGARK